MKYAAVICPPEPLLNPNVAGFLEKRTSAGTGWRMAKHPPDRGSTELAEVRLAAEGSPAKLELFTTKLGRYFDKEENRLWLPRLLFEGLKPPEKINLLHPSPTRSRQPLRTYKREQVAPEVRTPPELLLPLSRGALYRAAPDQETGHLPIQVVQEQKKRGQPRTCSERHPPRAMLNPWVFSFDTRQALDSKDLELFEEMMKEAEVDFHLDFPPTDWLRVRLHAHLRSLWAQSPWAGGGKPPLPRLMFGGEGEEWQRARAFLVLDSIEGVFGVTGGVGPCAGSVKFGWDPSGCDPSERTKLSGTLQQHRPVAEALRVLGVHPPGKDGDPAPQAPTEEADEGRDSSHSALKKEPCRKCEEETLPLHPVFKRIFDKLRDGSVPRELMMLLRGLPEPSEKEKAAVNSIAAGAGGDSAAFTTRFVREYIMPRSRILVAWPPPPEWLEEHESVLWSCWKDAGLFDPTLARHGEIPEGRLTVWWLRLILPGKEEVPSEWKAGNYLWKGYFFAALFRTGEAPQWADLSSDGRLGSDKLGHFVLGGRSRREDMISGPWMYGEWPAEFYLPHPASGRL